MAEAARQMRETKNAFGIDIPTSQICIIKAADTKHKAIEKLVDAAARNPAVTDRKALSRAVHEREAVSSTGMGDGVGIPHVRIAGVATPVLAVGIAPKGLDFESLDNKPVHILVLFVTPEGSDKEYLGHLAQVMQALRDRDFFARLASCRSPSQVYDVLTG